MNEEVVREEHVARWEWDNLAALYRCAVPWLTGDNCSHVEAAYGGLPWQAVHVRLVVVKDG